MCVPSTIAIDGPAASGKSTIGYYLAQRLSYLYLDTGVLYRAVTWAALQQELPITDEARITHLAEEMKISVLPPTVNDGRQCTVQIGADDITWAIRAPEVDAAVSPVSTYPGVREALTQQMRRIAAQGCVVMVGRDIGTVVLPDADLKIYVVASAEERARRRVKDLEACGRIADYEAVLANIRERDAIDSSRAAAPLKPAEDAVILDNSDLSFEALFRYVERLVGNCSAFSQLP